MDTASQIVRAKYEELLDSELGLAEFSLWIDALPFPTMLTDDFRSFIALVIRAQSRLTLWSDGAPGATVLASLRWVLLDCIKDSHLHGPDPLEAYKRKYVASQTIHEFPQSIELW